MTAKEARTITKNAKEKATSKREQIVNQYIDELCKKIQERAMQGYDYYRIYDNEYWLIPKEVFKFLKKEGYQVKYKKLTTLGSYGLKCLEIRW